MTSVTVILTSHMKGRYLGEAIDSVLAQTRLADVHVLLVDSGAWLHRKDHDWECALMHAVAARTIAHPQITWLFTGEPANQRHLVCPVAAATNWVIRAGYVTTDYVCTFYDDDRYHSRFVETMAGYLDDHPTENAVWCSQNWVTVDRMGQENLVRVNEANRVLFPGDWDCQVDGGQVMFRRGVLDAIGDPWLPESPLDADCRHSDGVFLERLGGVCGQVAPLPDPAPLYDHRFTPVSVYTPHDPR